MVPSTPLISINGVALDSETTGLDPKTARLVQICAIRVNAPTDSAPEAFETLVRPGVPIPPATTAIHGLSDDDVASAPGVETVLPELEAFLGEAVVIGHTIGFDLELLAHEAARAGFAWRRPAALDVRHLARIAAPGLANYGLDGLCSWLEVEIHGRHTARGDAEAAAAVFRALLPRLRARGVRTVGEAEAATRRLLENEAREHGDLESLVRLEPSRDAEAVAGERIDSYPYRHRVREVMSAPPAIMPPEATLGEAVEALVSQGVSSVFVRGPNGEFGIVTERDALRALKDKGAQALETPLGELRRAPLITVDADEFVYRAIGRMDRRKIRHLGVLGADGSLVGAVTTRNLLRHRATTAMTLGDEVIAAKDEQALGRVWARTPVMARRLSEEGVDPRTIAEVVSAEIRAMTGRAAVIGEARLLERGLGPPPARFAVLVLGSAGRGESLLAADQDNAIVYEALEPAEEVDRWFAALGEEIAQILDQVGVVYCKGGVMAKNAAWRKSVAGWEAEISGWIARRRPEDLLNVDIFFDAAVAHGDEALGEALWRDAFGRAKGQTGFLHALADRIQDRRAPLTLFGAFRTGADNRVDLKMNGLFPIVTVARILAMKAGAPARSTPERLRAAVENGLASEAQIEALEEAHRVILGAMLDQQITDAAAGAPLGPRVDPRILTKRRQIALRESVRQAPDAVGLVREGML